MPYTAAQKRAYARKMAAARARRPVRRRITGRGAYSRGKVNNIPPGPSMGGRPAQSSLSKGVDSFASRMGRQLAGAAATALIGGLAAGPMGAAASLGKRVLAGGIRMLMGRGDYITSGDVSENSLMSGRPPKMVNKSHKGETVISNSEFLTDIYTSNTVGAFQVQGFAINPGLISTFPEVAAIAANYEEYRVEGLAFEFRSMSADALNSTNTALGSVIMCCNYNANAPLFTNKAEMENYDGGVSSRPSKSIMFFVECARMQSVLDELYTRTGSFPPTNSDIRFNDLGNFQIATNGFQAANVNVGELWVTYQFGLLKLRMYVSLGNFNGYWRQGNSSYNATTGLLGTGTVTAAFQNMICVVAAVGGSGALATYTNGLYFPSSSIKQSYRVQLTWVGSGASAIRFPQFITVGCIQTYSGAPAEGTPTSQYEVEFTAPNVGDTAFSCTCGINITTDGLAGIRGFGGISGGGVPGAYIAFQNSTTVLPTSPTNMQITVTQIPNQGGQAPTPFTDW